MRSKYSPRWSAPHAERGLVRKRQTTLEIHPATSSGGFVLTAPTTLTILETITNSASSSAPTASSSSLSSSSRSEVSAITTSSSEEQSTSTSSTSATTSLQTPPQTATDTTSAPTISPSDVNNNGTIPLESGALSTTQVPGGAIAAIVIACLIVIAVGLFYLVRLKSKRDRMKLRPMWSRSGSANGPRGISSTSYRSSQSQTRIQFPTPVPPPMPPVPRSLDPPPIVQIPGANVTVPPRLYNSSENNNNNNTLNPALTSSNLDLISTPKAIYTLGQNGKRSAFSATVTSTFITTLPDELSIDVGEMLRVVAEYDDGWSLCMNVRGEQGMVPNECLDRAGGGAYSGRQPELREGVSMSSLASTAESLRDWRSSRRASSLRRP